jgi:hypothetical protein
MRYGRRSSERHQHLGPCLSVQRFDRTANAFFPEFADTNEPYPMELKPGEKLGPYEILSRIGAGGMGEV